MNAQSDIVFYVDLSQLYARKSVPDCIKSRLRQAFFGVTEPRDVNPR